MRVIPPGSKSDEPECLNRNLGMTFLYHKIWKRFRQQFSKQIGESFPLMKRSDTLIWLKMRPDATTECRYEPFHKDSLGVCDAHSDFPGVVLCVRIDEQPSRHFSSINGEAALTINEACHIRDISPAPSFVHDERYTAKFMYEQHQEPYWAPGPTQI
jgi:hypothetical protein